MYVIHRRVYFERYCILKSFVIIIWFGRPKIYPARNKTNICHGRSLFINFCFYSLHRDPFERNTQPQNHSTFLHMLLFDLVFQSSKSWFLLDCCADSWYQMKLCFYWDLNNFLLLQKFDQHTLLDISKLAQSKLIKLKHNQAVGYQAQWYQIKD